MRIIFSILVALVTLVSANAQELSAVRAGNYAGVQGLLLNPSSGVNSPYRFDFQVFGINAYLTNNYVHVENSSVASLIAEVASNEKSLVTNTQDNRDINALDGDDVIPVNDDPNGSLKSFLVKIGVELPGLQLNMGRHSFGVYGRTRVEVSGNSIPESFARIGWEGIRHQPLQNIDYTTNTGRIGVMNWSEVNLNYGFALYNQYYTKVHVGATLKLLTGHNAAFLVSERFNYNNTATDDIGREATLNAADISLIYGHTDLENPATPFLDQGLGSGTGIDIGATFIQKGAQSRADLAVKTDYLVRLSVALLDVGAITFNKESDNFAYNTQNASWERWDSLTISGIQDFDSAMSAGLLNDPTASRVGSSFTMNLPSALSVQADFKIRDHVYVNTSLIYGLPSTLPGIDRSSALTLTPRYEHRIYEIGLPLILYNFNQPQIGLHARLGGFYIGSENLTSYLVRGEFDTFHFNLGYSFNIARSFKENVRSSRFSRSPKMKMNKCFKF